jgi:hypothetical protein
MCLTGDSQRNLCRARMCRVQNVVADRSITAITQEGYHHFKVTVFECPFCHRRRSILTDLGKAPDPFAVAKEVASGCEETHTEPIRAAAVPTPLG